MQALAGTLQPALSRDSAGEIDSPEMMRRRLFRIVQDALHFTLCVTAEFLPNLLRFPALLASCTTIDILPTWNEAALCSLTLSPCSTIANGGVDSFDSVCGAARIVELSKQPELANLLGTFNRRFLIRASASSTCTTDAFYLPCAVTNL
jgi:hypothetical protein